MNGSTDKELMIVTPEQVQLQFQTAGLGSRALAHLVDGFILTVVNFLLVLFTVGVGRLLQGSWSFDMGDYVLALIIIFFLLLNLGYLIGTEAFMGGQTPGKRIIGVRVLQNNGQSATVLSIVIRNLFRLLDMLPSGYFLGAVTILLSSRDKRIGDMVAGTMVVMETRKERLKRRKRIDRAIAKRSGSIPHVLLDDIQKRAVTSEDWSLLHAWAERLPNLHEAKLQELSAPIAAHFAHKLGLDHEQYPDKAAYVIAVYQELREDWEV
ncbi:RDD family protein [Paenibacillus hexagrammi]|uniref:RDD family protein n=1 Tax=Paenibacillus hexagrammi TaxID=2908839 RepID=A0ABY3SHH9_9BACL|nr:RDD family protein [Paenibacillus sp. YPD9-1]UJF32575.1 RDD family protein [Paenibacillus sp. YPD9-1]